jgi:hypothetical protein
MTLLQVFKEVKDHRSRHGRRFQLEYVLLFSVFAMMSGATGYMSIARFIKAREKILKEIFNLDWKKMPSKSVLQKIFIRLDIGSMEKAFRKYSKYLVLESQSSNSNGSNSDGSKTKDKNSSTGITLAVDGKTLKNSYNNATDTSALNILSAFETNSQIILAHIDIPNKESEITAVQQLIQELNMTNIEMTMDALHTQKKQ